MITFSNFINRIHWDWSFWKSMEVNCKNSCDGPRRISSNFPFWNNSHGTWLGICGSWVWTLAPPATFDSGLPQNSQKMIFSQDSKCLPLLILLDAKVKKCAIKSFFQFDDIYESTKDDPFTRAFSLILMVGLIIWGSLIMVNLLIAIIVSDIKGLRESGHLQALINKGQHIVHIDTLFKVGSKMFPSFSKKHQLKKKVYVCSHTSCR